MNIFNKETISKIRSQSQKAEGAGKIPSDWLKLVYEKKLFKLFVPQQDGGLMMPLPEALRLFDKAAYIDGNLGWAITIGSGGGYFYAYMQSETAKKVFEDKKSVVAGSGAPTGTATKVKGGYKVSGRWKYCSGAPYATSFTANVVIKNDPLKAFIFTPRQVKIYKDWDAFGMRATESHSMGVKDVFVPEEMTFDLSESKLFYEHHFYRYPFLQFAETSFAAVSLGLGRHFFEEAKNMLVENKSRWSAIKGRYEFVKQVIVAQESVFKETSAAFYKLADKSWGEMLKAGKLNSKTQEDISKTSKKASRAVLASADRVMQYMGMGAVMQNTTINRIWRDMHTACQHVLLVPYNRV